MKNLLKIKFITRIAVLLLVLFPICGTAYSVAKDVTLRSLEIGENGASVTIQLDGNVTTRNFVLNSPSRWVLDITPARWGGELQQVYSPQGTENFGKIRIGQWQKRTARLVIHTNGIKPSVDVNGERILITFGENISSTPNGPTSNVQTAPEKIDNQAANVPPVESASTIPARETEKGTTKAVEVPRVIPVADSGAQPDLPKPVEMTETPLSATIPGGIKGSEFEIMCDGTVTKILINLTNNQSYNVQGLKYPDRLLVEYPTLADNHAKAKTQFQMIGREKLPIGVVQFVSRYESTNVAGYNKLLFEATSKFNYNTSVENGQLRIDIRPIVKTAKVNADDKTIPENSIAQSLKQALTETKSAESVTLLDEKAQTDSGTGSDATQKFNPPDQKSFLVKNGTGETTTEKTTPETTSGIKLKEVTTGDSRTAGIKDMVGTIPEHAKSSLTEGSKALEGGEQARPGEDQSGVPLMIEPPEEYKPLPKGSRPAADLFLTKGESVILPVKGLVRASVGDPEVVVINVLSQEELLVTAKKEGRTTLILWEPDFGRSVRWVNVGTSSLLKTIDLERVINNPNIKVNFIGEGTVVLEGKVISEEEKKRAENIAGGAAAKVVNLIEMSDPRRVLVKVRIVEIQGKDKEDFLKQIGAGTRTEAGDFQFNVLSEILNPELPGGGIFDINIHPGIVHGNSGDQRFDPIDIALNYLEQTRKGKILSQPNIVVLSGRNAHFRVGGEVPYTYQNENGVNVVNFREFGIQLDVLPNVDSDNNILVHVEPMVRTVDNTLAIAGVPGFRTREVRTDIQVKDRQTIVIGGLLQNEVVTTKAKVPLLGDIPFIGEAFKSKKHSEETTELLIFLTPSVVKDITSVESDIRSDEDVSLSPYYQKEAVESSK